MIGRITNRGRPGRAPPNFNSEAEMSIVTEQDLKDIDDAIKVDKIHAPIHEKLRDVYFDLAKAYREHEDMMDMILA